MSEAIEIARRLSQLGETKEACQAYTLALRQVSGHPDLELEAALYLFFNGGDYKVAYTTFVGLYRRGLYREDLLKLLTGAFYEPNVRQQKTRYEKNCKLLKKYPLLFRKDFLPFDQLPIRFYPYDDNGYLPFFPGEGRFGDYVDFGDQRITRNFFKDLDQPILAKDVYSMYELTYLRDNVRRSEWVGRDNHIYLHYTDWGDFCAHLQVLNLRDLLKDEKFVFLVGEEVEQYPIDFKARFGVDYSKYPVQPLHPEEFCRLIWHTQLSAHNGGDFFNEIFDGHPNLLMMPSLLLSDVETGMENLRQYVTGKTDMLDMTALGQDRWTGAQVPVRYQEMRAMKDPSDKNLFLALFLGLADLSRMDPRERVVPAIFFQPHFHNIEYDLTDGTTGAVALYSEEYQAIRESPVFAGFPYIKTFTPIRRPTTSCAATVKFMSWQRDASRVVPDVVLSYVQNRSFLVDPEDRLLRDSVLVRFEDGKLDPKATFTALASFLDLPYDECMTYCSDRGVRDPHADNPHWYSGFSTTGVYATYDQYAGKPERYFLEYFLRDVYEYCGYDFQYYDGAPMDMDRVRQLARQFDVQDGYIRASWLRHFSGDQGEQAVREAMEAHYADRERTAEILLQNPRFVSQNGQPLRMMRKLELDPALLEAPLYH